MPALKNGKHEKFAQAVFKGETQDQAYQTAGYSPHSGNASILRGKKSISERIAELQEVVAKKSITTVEDIARQLDEDRAFAKECGSASASVAASMGKAKVLGLIIEKQEHSGKDGAPLTPVINVKLSGS